MNIHSDPSVEKSCTRNDPPQACRVDDQDDQPGAPGRRCPWRLYLGRAARQFPTTGQAFRSKAKLVGFISALALPALALGRCGEPAQDIPKPPTVVRVQAAKVVSLASSVTLTG